MGVERPWRLDTCEIDLRVGGSYRWVWRDGGEGSMAVSGVCLEVEVPTRLAMTERFDEPWYEGEGQVATDFEGRGDSTFVRMRLTYETEAARDSVMASPMPHGMRRAFLALDAVLARAAET